MKATDTATGLSQQINIDRARMLTDTEDGTEVAFTLEDVIIVKEAAEVLIAASRCRWAFVTPVNIGDDPKWVNVDLAQLISPSNEGTTISWEEDHQLTVKEKPDAILGGTREPRLR